MSAPNIKFRRADAGSYYANNGADILDPTYLSATIGRSGERGRYQWVTRYFLQARPGEVAGAEHETLAEAKQVAALVLAERDQLGRHWDDRVIMKSAVQRLVREFGRQVASDALARKEAHQ